MFLSHIRDRSGLPPLRSLWWLKPEYLFSIAAIVTTYWAVSLSHEGYKMYGATKYINGSYFFAAIFAAIAFVVGTRLAARSPVSTPSDLDTNVPMLTRWFWIAAACTTVGYLVWLANGVKNGFRPGMILDFLRQSGDVKAYELKERIFTTVPGFTTLTQCAAVAVIIGLLPPIRKLPYVKLTMIVLVGAAFVRGLLLNERLAFIELMVPATVTLFRAEILGRVTDPLAKWVLRALPVLGVGGLLVLFGTFEYYRSYAFYKKDFNNIAEFTIWRISAYYTTGHNNSALIIEEGGWPLPYYTLNAMWTFPVVKKSPLAYDKLTGVQVDEAFEQLLRNRSTFEYNNEGGLFSPLIDYGYLGFGLFWFAYGYGTGRSYRSWAAGNAAGLCFYPLLFLTLLETPRFLYLCISRCTPQLAIFFLIAYYAQRPHAGEAMAASPRGATA